MPYAIKSKHALTSDWLPPEAFTREYADSSEAVAIAIEGVDDPEEEQVLVIDVSTGETVWDSTKESYE